MVVLSRAITRRPASLFGGAAAIRPPSCCSCSDTVSVPASRSRSLHRSPAASPRRSPRSATRWNRAYSRCPRTWRRNSAVCPAVHTPTTGRQPSRSHRSVRAGVHTCGRGRAALGSSGPPARVDRDQPGADRAVERRPQRRVDPVQCRRADRAAERGLVAGDRGEHGLHVPGRQSRQRDPAQVRDQVAAHVRGVAAAGRGAQRHPRRQPPAQPLPRRQARLRRRGRGRQRLHRRDRCFPSREPAPPYPAPLPRRRRQVDAEVPRPVPRLSSAAGSAHPSSFPVDSSRHPHRRYTEP